MRDPLRSRVLIIPRQWNSPNSSMERRQNQLLFEAQECPQTLSITPISGNTGHDQDEGATIYGEMPYYQHELLPGSWIGWKAIGDSYIFLMFGRDTRLI